MKTNKLGYVILLFVFLFTGCGNKEAEKRLEEAKALYENKQFMAAKNAIDSINILYPREVEIRREALTLMRLVERGESEQNIAYCDSLLPIRLGELDDFKKGFVFEKDSLYDEIGKYIWQSMTIEKNVERSYVRCGVDEEGEMYIESVYFGRNNINHTGLKFSTDNNLFAETPSIPYDGGINYRFEDLGNKHEIVSYKGENCKEIANFITLFDEKERIKAEYTGGTPYSIHLSNNDKKAIKATYELASILSEITAMQREKDKSEKRIILIDERLRNTNENQ